MNSIKLENVKKLNQRKNGEKNAASVLMGRFTETKKKRENSNHQSNQYNQSYIGESNEEKKNTVQVKAN